MTEDPSPQSKDVIAKLNKNARKRSRERKSSFFVPELNKSDDPHGVKAFQAGNVGADEEFAEKALALKESEDKPSK